MAGAARSPFIDLMTQMDRLEELLEDMAEFGFRSVEEIEERIALLDKRLAELEESEAEPEPETGAP
jgi:uncharacterized small protein (DUF1192 family)